MKTDYYKEVLKLMFQGLSFVMANGRILICVCFTWWKENICTLSFSNLLSVLLKNTMKTKDGQYSCVWQLSSGFWYRIQEYDIVGIYYDHFTLKKVVILYWVHYT